MSDLERPSVKCSMADVARLAGTSKSTVSRVLSGRGTISPIVRERVLRVVDETGFVPDAFGQRLAQARATRSPFRHNAIAVVFCVSEIGFSRFWDETYAGVMTSAQEQHLSVLSVMLREEELTQNAPPAALSRMQYDGMLVLPMDPVPTALRGRLGPCVLFGATTTPGTDLPSVEPDNEAGIAALAAHLIELGHRRIEYAQGDAKHTAFSQRWEALRRIGEARKLTLGRPEPVCGRFKDFAGRFAAEAADTRASAIIASDDQTAVNLMHALLERGVSVPHDVSVVGFDGTPVGAHSVPPLTTWRVDWRGLGRLAVSSLVGLIEERPVASRTLAGGALVLRQSTARPRVAEGVLAATA